MSQHVEVTRRGPVLELRLNRPDKKNALTFAMYDALADALGKADADPEVRAVVFSGAGDIFTAGNDLNDFLAGGAGQGIRPAQRFLEALARSETPLVAAVHGAAVGIGTTMLLHCDLVYAAAGTRLITPFVSLGLVPEAASSMLLTARIGYARAAEMLLLAEPLSAEEAQELGLVSRVFPAGEVLDQARARAERLAALPPEAVRATKALMRRPERERVLEQMDRELERFNERLGSPEARAAMEAFFRSRSGGGG